MSKNDIISKVEELKSLEALVKEAEAEIDSIKDELKQYMNAEELSEMEVGTRMMRYITVVSDKFDTARFKKDHGDMYKDYTRQSTTKRFTVTP